MKAKINLILGKINLHRMIWKLKIKTRFNYYRAIVKYRYFPRLYSENTNKDDKLSFNETMNVIVLAGIIVTIISIGVLWYQSQL